MLLALPLEVGLRGLVLGAAAVLQHLVQPKMLVVRLTVQVRPLLGCGATLARKLQKSSHEKKPIENRRDARVMLALPLEVWLRGSVLGAAAVL